MQDFNQRYLKKISKQLMNDQLLSYKKIQPCKFQVEIFAPPSKSMSHRLLILAALSGQPCEIANILLSEDILITIQALSKMGFRLDQRKDTVIFSGERQASQDPVSIDFGNSGTSARLLTAVAAITPGKYVLSGSERMLQRPMLPLISALTDLGADLTHADGFLPITIYGGAITEHSVIVDASQSSQFVSALMLIAPHTRHGLKIIINGPIASESYIQLTQSILEMAGIRIQTSAGEITIPGQQVYKLDKIRVEGDYSSISYFAVGTAISNGKITIRNLAPQSAQGDKVILDIIRTAGAQVSEMSKGYQINAKNLRGFELDMLNYPDLVPATAILALFCKGSTRIFNIEHLQYKESNRIQAIISNIDNLGGSCKLEGTDLIILPQPLRGGLIRTFNDHRIAMSFSLLGLMIPGIKIENPDCVRKSYPNFWEDFASIHQRA
jgi:3-phosphoshikimate 1-carboxyvinyltransferase